MAGGDVHVAVAHKEGGFGVRAEVGHQAVDAGGVGFDRHAGPAAPHQRKGPGGKVVVDDAAAEGVRLVGKDRRLDALGPEGIQQLRDAGIGGGLVLLVGVVAGGELGQGGGQLFGAAAVRRGEALHQLGDAVAHHVFVLLHRKGGPAVLGADPVAGVGQVVDGVQEGAVQIKENGVDHRVRSFQERPRIAARRPAGCCGPFRAGGQDRRWLHWPGPAAPPRGSG